MPVDASRNHLVHGQAAEASGRIKPAAGAPLESRRDAEAPLKTASTTMPVAAIHPSGLHHSQAAQDDALRPLMLAAAEGCASSFEQLYRLTSARLFSTVLRVVPERATAEDVLQELYVKVWLNGRQFDPQRGHVIHWLRAMARRAAIDALRRAACRPVTQHQAGLDDDPYVALPADGGCPQSHVEQAQRQHMVRSEVLGLPAEQKECVMLAFAEGLSHAEIASRLASPLGTIKSRIRRTLLSMRPRLQALQSVV